MTRILRYFMVSTALFFASLSLVAQTARTHQVKKSETIYGIAHAYGLTEQQLRQANAGMSSPSYVLKEGAIINIPALSGTSAMTSGQKQNNSFMGSVRVGVLLPLHKENNDGRRMLEYYRGVLMACERLKREGLSIDVYAWNLPANGDVKKMLQKAQDARLNILIGPYYEDQVSAVSQYCKKNDVLTVLPSDIVAQEVKKNPYLFQIYQSPSDLNESTARRCADWFKDYHPVIVDCKDAKSTKGAFTQALRKQLDDRGLKYNLTSLQSTEADFARAFSTLKPNLVVPNTASSADLQRLFDRLSTLRQGNPDIKTTVFGYEEWLAYTRMTELFFTNDVFIPTPYFTNLQSDVTELLTDAYRQNFNQDMIPDFPRQALTGFDHAMFFIRGYSQYGKSFDGAAGRVSYLPVQTPLKFERQKKGGLLNRAFMFMHYRIDRQIEALNY